MADEKTHAEEAVGTGNDARIAMLNSIGNQVDHEWSDQENVGLDVQDEQTEEQTQHSEQATEEQQTTEQTPVEEQETQVVTEAAKPDKYKLKVSGKEIELTLDEIIERAQKVEAADSYLAEAKRLMNENKPQKPSTKDVDAAQLEEMRDLARAIQMGTEDEAVEAIAKIRKSSTPSFSKDDLARTVDERLTFQQAVSVFQDEYKDLYNDPKLRQMVIDQDAALVASGDTRTYLERYRAIGKELRDWRDSLVKSSVTLDKQERKAAGPVPVKAAGVKVKPSQTEDDIEETTEQVIAKMAKARGGAQWMNS